MRRIFFLVVCLVFAWHCQAQSCLTIHGRARFYSGDSQLRIWHIGTHHEFAIYDDTSSGMLFKYLCSPKYACTIENPPKSLYADFTVCPTEKFKPGAAQPVTVKGIKHAAVVPWK
ncbi:MAG: hypothetical protein ABSG84_15450 [Acidobacteriaceae bacterium]|jgi:hypothetical protein